MNSLRLQPFLASNPFSLDGDFTGDDDHDDDEDEEDDDSDDDDDDDHWAPIPLPPTLG